MNADEILGDVACIVVHHNSPETLVITLESLCASGMLRDQILVVDNSSDAAPSALPAVEGFFVLCTSNRGYAAAVNDGLSHLNAQGRARPFTLVSTHESLPAPDAVRSLRDELLNDQTIAVVGPTLLNADSGRKIWSVGGLLTPRLKLPRHHVDLDVYTLEAGVDREWLDGAFTMYRTADLEEFKLDETYFLYFEETDLHTRLRRAGRRVVWVPRASVSQRSSGIPPRLLGRNLFLFHHKLFSKNTGRLAVSFELGRSLARALFTQRGRWSAFPEILKGWLEGEKLRLPTGSLDSTSGGGRVSG